jgi:polyhydroxybutyrate depolymerase
MRNRVLACLLAAGMVAASTAGSNARAQMSTVFSLAYGGAIRDTVLHLPANYSPNTPYPLVLVFHGTAGTGAGMEATTGFDAVADQNGFLVAYPDSMGSQWALTGANNDVSFVETLVQTLEASFHIDPTRIYLSGYSQGAGLGQQLAFCDPQAFAGLADISENLSAGSQSVCKANMPLSFLLFHGTADPVSPFGGGPDSSGAITYSAQQTATTWGGIDACPTLGTPAVATMSDMLNSGSAATDTKQTWSGCTGAMNVTFYTIGGGGHTWPGGTQPYTPTLGPVSQDVNASQIIWQTLGQHANPAAFGGVCGTANKVATKAAPSLSLCLTGVDSAVTGSGPWSWTCAGYNGGAAAHCSAPLQP